MDAYEALVLQTSPYSENSLIVHLLTREAGVLRALAKGARSRSSRYQGVFEPFNAIGIFLTHADPERLATAGEANVHATRPWLRREIDRFAWAGLGMEVLGRVAGVSPPEPFFHDEGVDYLKCLGTARGPGSLTIALLLRLLYQSGTPPQLGQSLQGQGALPATVTYHFEEGTFEASGPMDAPQAMGLPGAAVAALRGALASPPPLDTSFELAGPLGPPLVRWLIRVWEDQLNLRFRSAEFLEKMVLSRGK